MSKAYQVQLVPQDSQANQGSVAHRVRQERQGQRVRQGYQADRATKASLVREDQQGVWVPQDLQVTKTTYYEYIPNIFTMHIINLFRQIY